MAQPARPAGPRLSLLARSGHLEYDRVVFFSGGTKTVPTIFYAVCMAAAGLTELASYCWT